MQERKSKPTEHKKTPKIWVKKELNFYETFHWFLDPKSTKNLTKIDKKSTRREKNSHDEGQEGQEGHQDRKKSARNENLRLQPHFGEAIVGDLGPAGGVGGE